MNIIDIAQQRLLNQHIAGTPFDKPADAVAWLGAVQAQDYAGAKWAVGQRVQDATDAAIDQAFADGTLLRTHVMRPTWHFVTPADIRWMLQLTAPRVNAVNASYYRKLALDDAVFLQSNTALAKALQGGKQLTRAELASALQQAGIATGDVLRLTFLMIRAELDGVICSGARRGKQFTYALLDERVPQTKMLERDEALAELTRRYFTSHGPATLQDFVWWSGLSITDARAGLEMVTSQLAHEVVDGQTYWFSQQTLFAKDLSLTAYLLPNFDEYTVGYTDRSALFDVLRIGMVTPSANVALNYTIVMNGQIVGNWKRVLKKDAVVITPYPFTAFTDAEHQTFTTAAHHYGKFLDLPVILA
jgi:hypothetical protein